MVQKQTGGNKILNVKFQKKTENNVILTVVTCIPKQMGENYKFKGTNEQTQPHMGSCTARKLCLENFNLIG